MPSDSFVAGRIRMEANRQDEPGGSQDGPGARDGPVNEKTHAE